MRNVPILLLLVGCASAPPAPELEPTPVFETTPPDVSNPQSPDDDGSFYNDDEEFDGSGGAPAIRNRGDAIAAFALNLRGTRYRYGGATPDGFDCSGLVFYAHRSLGLVVPRTSRDQSETAESIRPFRLRRGDLVFFRFGSSRVNHVGIYIGRHRFVHAPGAGKPVTINSLDEAYYAEAFSSAGRFWNQLPR